MFNEVSFFYWDSKNYLKSSMDRISDGVNSQDIR